MTRRIDDGILFDYLEGLLGGPERREVEAKLEGDAASRARLEELQGLLSDLSSLPGEAEPARDLWPAIETRLVPHSGRAGAHDKRPRGVRWFGLPISRLIAAGLALAIVSGGSYWLGVRAVESSDEAAMASQGGSAPAAGTPVLFIGDASLVDYDQVVAELTAILDAGRERLGPETVEVLERSLAEIDRAIEEAREALRQDPESATVGRILSKHLRTKLDVLRRAAAAVKLNA